MSKVIDKLVVERLHIRDYEQLVDAMKAAYPGWLGSFCTGEGDRKRMLCCHIGPRR